MIMLPVVFNMLACYFTVCSVDTELRHGAYFICICRVPLSCVFRLGSTSAFLFLLFQQAIPCLGPYLLPVLTLFLVLHLF